MTKMWNIEKLCLKIPRSGCKHGEFSVARPRSPESGRTGVFLVCSTLFQLSLHELISYFPKLIRLNGTCSFFGNTSNLLGLYRKIQIKNFDQDRPVYKRTQNTFDGDEVYLFYNNKFGEWQIAPNVNGSGIWLFIKSNGKSFIILDFEYWLYAFLLRTLALTPLMIQKTIQSEEVDWTEADPKGGWSIRPASITIKTAAK